MLGKKFALFFILILLLATAVSADELRVEDVDAYVNENFFQNVQENTNTLVLKPGDLLRFSINLENRYPKSSNEGINGIELQVNIDGIQDGYDLYYESDAFGLDSGEDLDKEVSFQIPQNALPGEYEVEINVEGFADSGLLERDSEFFEIIVEGLPRNIQIEELYLEPNRVECGETSILNFKIVNLGSQSTNVIILAENDALGFSQDASRIIGSFGSNNEFESSFLVNTRNSGNYGIKFELRTLTETIEDSVSLSVECEEASSLSVTEQSSLMFTNQTSETEDKKDNTLLYILILATLVLVVIFVLIILGTKK